MTALPHLRPAWSRLGTLSVRLGALAALLYGTSFYTRDWRPLVPDAARIGEAQAASRPRAGAPPAGEAPGPATATAAAAAVVPAPGSLARPSPAGWKRARGAGAPARRAQGRRTRVASGPAQDAAPSGSPTAPVQFALAERGN